MAGHRNRQANLSTHTPKRIIQGQMRHPQNAKQYAASLQKCPRCGYNLPVTVGVHDRLDNGAEQFLVLLPDFLKALAGLGAVLLIGFALWIFFQVVQMLIVLAILFGFGWLIVQVVKAMR